MSASTAALSGTNFRRIDIDQYDEDRVDPSSLYHPDPRGPAQALAGAQEKDRTVRGLLQRGDVGSALKEVLREGEWPYGEDSVPETKQAKATALATVLSILNSTRSTDIPALVQQLDPSEQVTLMKYLYKAMENLGDTSGNVVLGWHEKLTEVAGIGCIVRVMSDRRRV
ncbi:Actin-related protein 2/3 complex subunit 5 [Rhodotorula toruloides ATCC 204091]|uniref:Actin-related protein 2/3 complex subunit 5 n=1 Tax=Rhodotorula toruloides TaxID=5286 RepID=A0A0K3CMY7_RHOTO|nr:Actin-related protein 2/3 complex subunit 5 [Rhodotorula toruloides ATCC 204091]KAK4330299.1 Actin-related protein 2/3 complex subunit 5 [Rhodotorula toruloides]PRQ70924.1 actin-related protein 2/3 complex subunit 5 [Rhodotorula toruloides]